MSFSVEMQTFQEEEDYGQEMSERERERDRIQISFRSKGTDFIYTDRWPYILMQSIFHKRDKSSMHIYLKRKVLTVDDMLQKESSLTQQD